MKKAHFVLLFCCLSLCSINAKAQDDSAFAEIYKTVRVMTDSLKTYSLYLVPFESTDKIKLGNIHQKRLLEVFHFLKKGKQLSFENPDFIIGFLVDDQAIYNPNGPGSGAQSSINNRTKISHAAHQFHFTVLVHTKNNQQLKFRMGPSVHVFKRVTETPTYAFNNYIKDSLSRRGYRGYSLSEANTSSSSLLSNNALLPDIDDYKTQLIKVLQLFKNKYVDRVYN